MVKHLAIIGILLLCCGAVSAQDSTAAVRRNRLLGLPIVYYTPETRLGAGGAGIYSFRLPGTADDSRPSQIQFGLTYTQERQVLSYLSYELQAPERRWYAYGELGYYRYFYNFYGIGNEQPADFVEVYSVNFPRLRVNLMQQILPNWFLGGRYSFDDYRVQDRAAGGQLITDEITGAAGGIVSSLGFLTLYDNRDNIFYPSRGWKAEGLLAYNGPGLGSPFTYTRITTDVSYYQALGTRQVLALNLFGDFTVGDPPFQELALLGGTKKARGFYQGRYRDKQLLLGQAEYRFPLFWRFRGALFAAYGGVAPRLSDFQLDQFRLTFGGGIRFALNPAEKIYVRLDVGWGDRQAAYYLTIGEAF